MRRRREPPDGTGRRRADKGQPRGGGGWGIAAAIAAVRAAAPGLPLEVECDTLAQVREALDAGARLILLDNMDLSGMRQAATMARRYTLARLEASGGLRLEAARAVAQTGVNFVAVGALSQSSPALDLGLDLL